MMIDKDSPLRRFPGNSENKQTLFFDGIRYSVEMAALAYARLQQTLYNITMNCLNASTNPVDFVPAILDAWSIIDSVHRLRILIHKVPGMKKQTPRFQIFDRSTSSIKDLRNFIQHLDEETQDLVGQNMPIWGMLSWFTTLDPEHKSGFICTIVAGTIFREMEGELVDPRGKTIYPPVDLITLTANDYSISLSDVMRHVETLVRSMEEGLQEQLKDSPPAQGDILVCAEVEFGGTRGI
jgi:hypothetical protein